MAGGISEVGFGSAVATAKLTPARTWACISFDAESLRAVFVKHSESSCSRRANFFVCECKRRCFRAKTQSCK